MVAADSSRRERRAAEFQRRYLPVEGISASRIRRTQRAGLPANSCSQIRITVQPAPRRSRFTNRSRRLFAASFSRQNRFPVLFAPFVILSAGKALCRFFARGPAAAATGMALLRSHLAGGECFGQPCQKHPSTKTAKRRFRKTKSILTLVGRDRRARRFASVVRITCCLRHPAIPAARKSLASANSVSRLPRERIAAITSDRLRSTKH